MCLHDAGMHYNSGHGSAGWIPDLPVTAGVAEQEIPDFQESSSGINNLAHVLMITLNFIISKYSS